MRERAQLWIGASNREEAMARVLSRADFNDGAVLHAHRAASSSLVAVFAEKGWAYASDRCADLCEMLDAHDVTAPLDVLKAARTLDGHLQKLNAETTQDAAAHTCTAQVAAECLDAVRRLRAFVNSVLTK